MRHGRRDARLPLEFAQVLLIGGILLSHHLERHHPVQIRIQRLVNRPHPAGAQHLDERKILQLRAHPHCRPADRAMHLRKRLQIAHIQQRRAIRARLEQVPGLFLFPGAANLPIGLPPGNANLPIGLPPGNANLPIGLFHLRLNLTLHLPVPSLSPSTPYSSSRASPPAIRLPPRERHETLPGSYRLVLQPWGRLKR